MRQINRLNHIDSIVHPLLSVYLSWDVFSVFFYLQNVAFILVIISAVCLSVPTLSVVFRHIVWRQTRPCRRGSFTYCFSCASSSFIGEYIFVVCSLLDVGGLPVLCVRFYRHLCFAVRDRSICFTSH